MAKSSRNIFAPPQFYWPIFRASRFLSERAEPAALIGLLDEYFSAFDDIMASHGLEKIKTIGDAYMAVGGVPETGLPPSDRRLSGGAGNAGDGRPHEIAKR